jgi:hypothetical protein
VYSSCEDEDKLPGSKPEILLGKWENYRDIGWSYVSNYIHEIYEFTPKGGSIKQMKYIPEEDCYEDYYSDYFTDWSYSENEKTIYFLRKKERRTTRWEISVEELVPDFVRLGGILYEKKNYPKN